MQYGDGETPTPKQGKKLHICEGNWKRGVGEEILGLKKRQLILHKISSYCKTVKLKLLKKDENKFWTELYEVLSAGPIFLF